ncbi:DUF2851 family protein [Labilibacter marinus]|uniref:DUF2851 family protein n=1 Tax=Labilibacter marinus TaxID=1477105 RepID=UPI00094F841A|nr:DUF2851 family protein [Labilibacter marinus]
MHEEFLQYIWQQKLYQQQYLVTECGMAIEVIHPGEINTNAGPDFFNAKIKIDDTLWAGNVEVHEKASDWEVHHHQKDKAYDNVILHVVEEVKGETYNSVGAQIPTLKIKYSSELHSKYLELKESADWLRCNNHLGEISSFEMSLWLQRMLVERLEFRMQDVQRILKLTTGNWDETFYRLLFRSFGFGVNGQTFEYLAQSIPLKVLLKYCDNKQLIEALLYGQAGLLKEGEVDTYQQSLQKDYIFLKNKHQLKSIDSHLWKFLRLRPSNFPTIRLAQLCSLMVLLKGVFGNLINETDLRAINKKLDVDVSSYWEEHFVFGKKSGKVSKKLGSNSKKLIIINTIIPYLFSYGKITGDQRFESRAFNWLSQLKAEKNSIVDKWKSHEISLNNAGDSQALIYLSNNYCKPKKCLRCRVGHKVLAIKK